MDLLETGRGIIFRLVETVVQWRALVDLIINFEVLYNARFININSCVYISFPGKTLFI